MIKTTIFDDEDEYEPSYGTSLVDRLLEKSMACELPKYDLFEYEPYEPPYDIKMGIKPMPQTELPSLELTTNFYWSSTGTICKYYS